MEEEADRGGDNKDGQQRPGGAVGVGTEAAGCCGDFAQPVYFNALSSKYFELCDLN